MKNMNKDFLKKYCFYLLRWQMSTPLLAWILWLLSGFNTLFATIIANFIGGCIFFFIDKLIFRSTTKVPLWEIQENVKCVDCGSIEQGYRIVEWRGYNRRQVKDPQFRCNVCKNNKVKQIQQKLK